MRLLKLLIFVLVLFGGVFLSVDFGAPSKSIKSIGHTYYSILNPVSYFILNGNSVEEQTIYPQFNENNINILIPIWNHSAQNRILNKIKIDQYGDFVAHAFTLGNDDSFNHLNTAWKLGRTVIPFPIFCFEHENIKHENINLLATKTDGIAALLYAVSWAIHTPPKMIRQLAYIIHENKPWYSIIDWCINIISVFTLELISACIGTILGFILGTLLNPLDTLCSIFGILYFGLLTIFTAVYDLIDSIGFLLFG